MRELLIASTCILLLLFYSNGQSSNKKTTEQNVSIELSIPHGDGLRRLNNCVDIDNEVFIILTNNTDSTVSVYENWNSYGYYNFSFEIKLKDSIYVVTRPQKLWYRNFPSHHSILPNETIVFQFDLIDTSCARMRCYRGIQQEDGWVGLPDHRDTAQIRVIYSLPNEYISYSRREIIEEEYLEYIEEMDSVDLEIYNDLISSEENENRIWIHSERMVSDWKTIIIDK